MRLSRLLAVVTALACGLTACGNSADDGPAANPPELTRITVGTLPIVDSASLYIAMKEGYFAEEGLDVELRTLSSGAQAVPGLRDGGLHFAIGNYVSFFASHAAGELDVRLVADAYQALPGTFLIMVPDPSAIRLPRDLAGKRIAVNTRANVVELIARSALRTAGVDLSTVTFVPVPFPEMANALSSRSVDAALMVEPYVTQLGRDHGAIPMIDAASGPTAQLPIAGWVTSAQLAAEKPNTVRAFQRAILAGQAAAATDRAKVEQVLGEFIDVDAMTASLMNLGTWPATLEANRVQRVLDLMSTEGQLSRPIDLPAMIVPPPPA